MRNILLTMIFYNLWWSQVVYSDFEKMQSNLSCKIFIAQNNKKYSSEIDGVIRYTTNKMEYCAFLGMPYALPPIKERRFEPPVLQLLENILENENRTFSHEPNWCLQAIVLYANRLLAGSEDCLYLNIFFSEHIKRQIEHQVDGKFDTIKPRILFPIVVWIHGGSFNYGSASAWSDRFSYFIEKNIIVITINYRLGPFGFLSVPDLNITGNNGLRDQQVALKWVQHYAKYFGGDQDRVTLMGWSAGAASVSYHLYTNTSQNLFKRVILMSGTMLSQWAFDANPNYCNDMVLTKIRKLPQLTNASLCHLLKTIDKTEFYPLYEDSISKVSFGIPQDCFAPTIDEYSVLKSPHLMIKDKPINEVSMLIGAVSIELNVNDDTCPDSFNCDHVWYPNQNETILKDITNYLNTMCNFLLKNGSLGDSKRERFMKFLSEIEMHHGVFELIENYIKYMENSTNIFVYQYSVGNIYDLKHGDDVHHILPEWPSDETFQHSIVSNRMQRMWENFIKDGVPTPLQTDLSRASTSITTWLPFSSNHHHYMNIDRILTMKRRDKSEPHVKLWKSVYDCLYSFECNNIYQYLNGTNDCI